MDFQKYINHKTTESTSKSTNPKKISEQKPRVIKFVGNMEENIKELLNGINCHCSSKKQFYNILIVFANKIEKLRTQRDHYKNTLKQYLLTMNTGSSTSRSYSALKPKNNNFQLSNHKQIQLESVPSAALSLSSHKQNLNPLTKVAKLFHKEQFKTLYTQESEQKTRKSQKKGHLKQSEQNIRNNFTAIKKYQNQEDLLLKQFKSENKKISKMSHLYQTQKSNLEQPCDEGSFSLNLSSFEELDQKEKETSEFMKEVSSIMSETNLLDSDDEEELKGVKSILSNQSPTKMTEKVSQLQEKVKKLKMLKQSNNFEQILISLNEEDIKIERKECENLLENKKCMKKKDNIEQIGRNQKKSVKKGDKQKSNEENKENLKGKEEGCLKKYNISLQKLQEFIQNKECLKQLQKSQHMDMNLKNFKSISSCTLKKDPTKDYQSLRQLNRGRPLQERKYDFNI